ncbi:TonB-dependent receptor [Paenochrobactrum pullorum]|uniref:TonB-dependent receptor n=1 Tax=Paenochrobactrum pullorum TaxID=1324351 RepID=UPI0035BBC7ED
MRPKSRKTIFEMNMSKALAATLMMSTALGFNMAYASAVLAQEQSQVSFSVPAGSLHQALTVFGRQAGLQVSFLASVTAGKTSAGVNGKMSSEAALTHILQGSGLRFSFINGTTVSVTHVNEVTMPSLSADGSIILDTITVTNDANKLFDATYTNAASTAYIPQKEIERFRGMSAGDFLKGEAGVMTGDNRNSGAIDVNIRGMQGFGRVPVIVDGAQQQNTVYRGYSGVASRNYIDPDMIGGVEIVKGPSSGVYGVGATGGVAVMRTLNADDIIKDGQNYGFRVRGSMIGNTSTPPPEGTRGGLDQYSKSYLTGCSWACTPQTIPEEDLNIDISKLGAPQGMDRPGFLKPTSGSGSVAFASRWENLELVAGYTRRKTGNYHAGKHGDTPDKLITTTTRDSWPGAPGEPDYYNEWTDISIGGLNRYRAGEEVLNTSQDNTSYMLKSKLMLGDGHSLNLGFMKYKSDFGELMPSMIIRFDGAEQAPLSHVSVDTYTARYNWNPEDNEFFNLTANLWHTKTDTHIMTPYKFGAVEMPTGYWDIAKRTGFDLSNESKFDTAWGDLTLSYGGSYTYETLAPPSDVDKVLDAGLTIEAARDGWRKESSGYISGEWKPLDWLKLDAGLRYTKTHSYDRKPIQDPKPDENYDTAPWQNKEERSSGFTPIVAVTVEPLDGLQFYVRYAEAIRAPSLFESTTGFSVSALPSIAIKPEHAKNWEFGTNLSMDSVFDTGDELRLKAVYFNNTIDDYLTRGIRADQRGGTSMRNLKQAKFKGFELSGRYNMGAFYTEASGIYYTDTQFCMDEEFKGQNCFSDGNPAGYSQLHVQPKISGSITLGARMFEESLDVGTRISYTGKRPTELLNITNGSQTTTIAWKPYTLVDLFASYKINDDTTLDFNVDNLTDVYYMDALTLGLMPSPGRTFRASLTAKF